MDAGSCLKYDMVDAVGKALMWNVERCSSALKTLKSANIISRRNNSSSTFPLDVFAF